MNRMFKQTFKKTIALTCLASLLSTAVLPTMSFAVSQEKPCEGKPNISAGGQKMRQSYCDAKTAAEEAANGQLVVSIAQGVVAATCGAACASSIWSFGVSEGWCTLASIGGTITSVIAAKEASEKMTALVGLAGPGMQIMQAGGMSAAFDFSTGAEQAAQVAAREAAKKAAEEAAKKAAEEAAKGVSTEATKKAIAGGTEEGLKKAGDAASKEAASHMSCLTAGLALAQGIMSYIAMDDSNDLADKNEELARSTIEADMKAMSGGGTLAAGSSATGGAGSVGSAAASPKDQDKGSDNSKIAQNKGACGGTGFDATMNCALAQPNNGLPGFIRTPEFRSALEKMSGMSADRLISLKDPGAIMGAGMGRVLSAEGQSKLASIVSSTRARVLEELRAGTYASSGGGSKGGGGDGMPDLNALMDKFMPKEAEKVANGKVGDINFGKKQLMATKAGDEENSGISIFDRITRRYQMSLSQDRLTQLPYQTRENRSLSTH